MKFTDSDKGKVELAGISFAAPLEEEPSDAADLMLPTEVGTELEPKAMQYRLPPSVSFVAAFTSNTFKLMVVLLTSTGVINETLGITASTVGKNVGEDVGLITVFSTYAPIDTVAESIVTKEFEVTARFAAKEPLLIAKANCFVNNV